MKALIVCVVLLLTSCAKAPVGLPPGDLLIFKADQAQVAIGTAQHAAIELNKIMVCPPAPCHPLLSDANTRMVISVVTDAVKTMQKVPNGWLATSRAALTTVSQRLDAAGKTTFASYVTAASVILDALQ